jgi:hypothetical protein
VVSRSGERAPFAVSADSALEFAKSAAAAFEVGPAWIEAAFDAGLVKKAADKKSADAKAKKEKREKAGS